MNKLKTDLISWESYLKSSAFSSGYSRTNKKKKISGFNTIKPYFENLINPIFKSKT